MNWPNNGNRWPLSRKKTVQLLVAITILTWATQTLLSQWSFGATGDVAPATAPAEPLERFVPGTARFAAGATVEIRSEATVIGEEIRFKQIARWSQQDHAVLAPVGELILARVGDASPFRSISIDEVRQTLRDAGVNIAALNFVGASACTVNRSDVHYDERTALQQWIDARHAVHVPEPPEPAQPAEPAAGKLATAASPRQIEPAADPEERSLRNLLLVDLAGRLALDPHAIQLEFKAQDDRLLNLAEPLFQFDIEPMRARSLGNVSWLVLIRAGDEVQKANISAHARVWQDQLVVARPLSARQVITEADLLERRALVDRVEDEPLLSRGEAIGQMAARDLKPGTVMTARLIDAVQLARPGQYITVTLTQGTVNIKTVAKALEAGAYGQTIRVKNESTRDVFQVVLTGPQTATMNLTAPLPPPQDAKLASTGNE